MLAAILSLCFVANRPELTDDVDIWEHNVIVNAITFDVTLTQVVWWRFETHDELSERGCTWKRSARLTWR